MWVSDALGSSQTPSSKASSEPWHLEADITPTLLQKPQGDGTLAHAGELASVPGVEGHAVYWLWEARGGHKLVGGHAPQGQGAVAIVPWGRCRVTTSAAQGSQDRQGSPETTVLRPRPADPE